MNATKRPKNTTSVKPEKALKPVEHAIEYPCIPVKQGNQTIYLFAAKASDIWSIIRINQRRDDKEEGYQRVLSSSRVRAISAYIKTKNVIPLSVLITFDNAEILDGGYKLKIPNTPDAGWVIDGQHRLAGAHEAQNDIELPIVAFVGLDIESQIQQFVTINREAKGVPASLYYDLLKHLPKKNVTEVAKERAADVASDLKRDESTPFFGKIVTTSVAGKGEISLNNFVRKIHPLLVEGKGHLSIYSVIEQKQILSNYYLGLQNSFIKEFNKIDSVFFQTVGFGALINALPTFLNLCLKNYKGFRIEDVAKAFKEVEHFDFEGWKNIGSGSAAELQAGEDLKAELISAFETISDTTGSITLA